MRAKTKSVKTDVGVEDNYKVDDTRYKMLEFLSDFQILAELGRRYEDHRRASRLPDQDIFATGGVKKDALAHFKKGKNVSLLTFIKILRGARLLGDLDRLLRPIDSFSPMAALTNQA